MGKSRDFDYSLTVCSLVGPVQCISEDFFKVNMNGESPFYFALKNRRWTLLKLFSSIPSLTNVDSWDNLPPYLKISLEKGNFRNTGKKVSDLLISKSRCDDVDFFREFFEAGIEKFFTSSLYNQHTRKSISLLSLSGTSQGRYP